MARLIITQVSGSNPPAFCVRNRETDQETQPAPLPSPYEWRVEHAGDERLMVQLRWYLETFLSYPYDPYTLRAAHIEAALKQWGIAAFNALFDNRDAGHWVPTQAGTILDIVINCDDPTLLAWPWEALHDPRLGYFGHRARIQRRLSHEIPDPPNLPELPKDRIRILMVTARPYGDDDVSYRSISRPLVDLIRQENLPASVHVLRPPTFDSLREHLEEHPGEYHILHFDGHGGYSATQPILIPGQFHGHEGRLLFEKTDGKPDDVTANRLATMLQGCTIPFVVLNACRSAQLDAHAAEGRAFASVAGSLIQAGFRGVLAMAYNLTVAGAQEFLPPFYRRLFKQGNLLEAAREGRTKMFDRPERSQWDSTIKLQDWLLPVIYQQRDDFDVTFAANIKAPTDSIELPREATIDDPFGFVGRDAAIHALERARLRPPSAVLVHGLGGIGKTTLVRHFLQWLRDTGGLERPPFWFSFEEITSASYVLDQLGRATLGGQFDSDDARATDALIHALHDKVALILVWDSFESAFGFEAEHLSARLSPADQRRLGDFLARLRGGKTKIIITSRSDEAWLPDTSCRRLPIWGLKGEELWDYAGRVAIEYEVPINHKDADVRELLTDLAGHPILIRAVLPQLKHVTAGTLRRQWQTQLAVYLRQTGDPARGRLMNSLHLALADLTDAHRECLIPLGLHERFINLDSVHRMGRDVLSYVPERMEALFDRLNRAGLIARLSDDTYSLHPLFTSYLRHAQTAQLPNANTIVEVWIDAFVKFMGQLAKGVASRELAEQRTGFALHQINFRRALALSEARQMHRAQGELTLALALCAKVLRNWAEARVLFQKFAEHQKSFGDQEGESLAYNQLGVIELELRNFDDAERWLFKALSIHEASGDLRRATSIYHNIGIVAHERRNFDDARRWYIKSLTIDEESGNLQGAAVSYHQLGRLAQERRNFDDAEYWYLKSLEIKEKLGNLQGTARAYHQLGRLAQERRNSDAAERWYLEALKINEQSGDLQGAAATYHQLGRLAQERGNFDDAEHWYLKSLGIEERVGNRHGAAITYNQLGNIAQRRRNFDDAERWYLKSINIDEESDELRGVADAYHNLGAISQERGNFDDAERWYHKSLEIKANIDDVHGAALTYRQLGVLSFERGMLLKSGDFLIQSYFRYIQTNDERLAQGAFSTFALVFAASGESVRDKLQIVGRAAFGDKLIDQLASAPDAS